MNSSLLPQTDSIQELAQFWDSHELTDLEDQLEEVEEPVFKRESTVQIALQAREIEAVTEIANSKGIKSTELIREWIIEKIETS